MVGDLALGCCAVPVIESRILLHKHNNKVEYVESTYYRRRLPAALSSLVLALLTSSAYAVTFELGEIQGQFDSSLSIGQS